MGDSKEISEVARLVDWLHNGAAVHRVAVEAPSKDELGFLMERACQRAENQEPADAHGPPGSQLSTPRLREDPENIGFEWVLQTY